MSTSARRMGAQGSEEPWAVAGTVTSTVTGSTTASHSQGFHCAPKFGMSPKFGTEVLDKSQTLHHSQSPSGTNIWDRSTGTLGSVLGISILIN